MDHATQVRILRELFRQLDSDDKLRAFVNACSHRGAKVAAERRGKRARFTCPFRAWTYSGQGELLRIPRPGDFGQLDKSCHGLLELPSAESDGIYWVHPDPTTGQTG